MKTIHTIGTQGMNDEKFIGLLKQHNIDAVIDIRLHNEGRWYKFASGKHISDLCGKHMIGYVHDTRFSPTREMLSRWRENQDWQEYERAYRQLMEERDMFWLFDEVIVGFLTPCLLCAEKSPDHCHRRLLAEHIIKSSGSEIGHIEQESFKNK
ncbi:DUF488 family protein [Verrucomicrobiota bacterium]